MEPQTPDPYEVLKIPPTATQATISAAYRKLAKQLHPDVAGTGNRDAFIRLQLAYRQLGDADSRAEFDRSRRPTVARPAWRAGEASLGFTRAVTWRRPRFIVPVLAGATVLAVAQALAVFWREPAPLAVQVVARAGPAQAAQAAQPPAANPAPARGIMLPATDFAGADHFIAPGPPLPWGSAGARLEPFTPVALLGAANAARAEVRLQNGSVGLVDAARLLPGDAHAARHAACLHFAGPPPRAGQLLVQRATGPARLAVENRDDRPAVLKLRDAAGVVIAAIYLAARGRADLADLPTGPLSAEYAQGDIWSAPCSRFAAGMRAQELAQPLTLSADSRLSLPAAGRDITDEAFARE